MKQSGKMHKNLKNNWFTLVELIVVVTILAILATIWFVSYSSYLIWVRDTNRLTQLKNISDSLSLYATTWNSLPIPEAQVEIKTEVWGTEYLIWYQWYAWSSTLESIEYEKWGKDPKDDSYFTYTLTKDRKFFQVMWWLEEWADLTASITPQTRAQLYADRVPTASWNNLWVITDADFTPIQEIGSVTSAWEIMLDGTGTDYTLHTNNSDVITWNDSTLLYPMYVYLAGRGNKTCKELLADHPYTQWTDGAYWIKTLEETVKLPCEMTTDGWGWTLVLQWDDTDMEKYDTRWNDSWDSSTSFIPYTATNKSFKFPDTTIWAIRWGWSYMLVWENEDGDPVSNVFVPETCEYNHEVWNTPNCNTLYTSPAHSSAACTWWDINQKWIWCFPGGAVPRFITNNAANGWVNTVCYMVTNGWCTGSTTNGVNLKMFVR